MTQQVLPRPFRYVSVSLCFAIVLTLMPFSRQVSAGPEDVSISVAYECGSPGSVTVSFQISNDVNTGIGVRIDNQLTEIGNYTSSGSEVIPVSVVTGTYIHAIAYAPEFGSESEPWADAEVLSADCTPLETPPPTPPTETPTETLPPETPTETLPPETPAVTPTETEVPSPTPTSTDIGVDPTTPTPSPTQDVLLPSPPPVTSTPVAQPTNAPVLIPEPPTVETAPPPPTPETPTFVFVVPDPTGGYYTIPEASASSQPGDTVRVNIAAPGQPPDWETITIPDPKNGRPFFKTKREVNAFIAFLNLTPTIGGLYFTEFPTIQVVPQPPVLIEQKEPKMERAPMSLGNLMSNGDEEDWLDITKKMMVTAAVVTVGAVTGGFLVYAYGPWNAVPAGTIFLAAVSQDGNDYEPVFHFFVAPDKDDWYLPPLPAGTYMMKLETLDGQVFQMPFTITDDPTQSLSMEQREDGTWQIVSEHNSSLEQRVNALPDTGAGQWRALPMEILGLAAISLGLLALSIRLVPAPSRRR